MAFSQAYKILLFTGIGVVMLPHFNMGLLSDYKICGDSECESLLSRVQAVRDHRGKDCRFLSFGHGDTIFVYHKLTGKREDLWAGTIDRQFGYFPRDAVKEEQIYATTEKIVETQKSDFICMDEFGYPVDSSHLDDDNDDDNDKETQNQNSETTHTILHTDKTTAESSSASAGLSTESAVSAQQPDSTTKEEDENQKAADASARTHEEAHETADVREQGGSHSSSWLGSSVTGWLGLGKEEEHDSLDDGEKKDDRKETQAEASVTSPVTGWLGFRGEGRSQDALNNREVDKETVASLTSTMSGWLGFGGKKKTDSIKKDEERETDDETEPEATFRSRRMSLDLEGSQLYVEKKRETGTLDWLGSGLSTTLGFGKTSQESETNEGKKETPVSNSWFDIGVGDILGLRNYGSEIDGFKQTEMNAILEQAAGSDNVDISQSQHAQTEDEKTEPDGQLLEEEVGKKATAQVGVFSISSIFSKDTKESNVEHQTPQSETEAEFATLAHEKDTKEDNMDASHGSTDSILPVDAAFMVDQTKLEETPVTGSEGQQMQKSKVNESEDSNREQGEEEITTESENVSTQMDTDLRSDAYSVDLNSVVQSVIKIEGEMTDEVQSQKTQSGDEEGDQITNQADSTEELTAVSTETGVNGRSAEESNGMSQPSLSIGSAKERNEPTHNEDESVPTQSADADNLDTVAMIDGNSIETRTHYGEFGSSGNRSTQTLYENASDADTLIQDTSMGNTDNDIQPQQMEQRVTQRQSDADQLEESETNSFQQVHTEKERSEFEKDVLNEMNQKSATRSETETETEEVEKLKQWVYEIKEEGNQENVEELRQEADKINEENQEEEELKEQEKQGKSLLEEENQAKEEECKEEKKGEMNKVNGLKETEKEEHEESQVKLPHYTNAHETGMPESKSNESKTDQNSKTEKTHEEEEKREEKKTNQWNTDGVKEEKEEVDDMQQVEDVGGERREKVEEERNLKCSNELYLHATKGESVQDMNENISQWRPADEATIQKGKQNDQTLAGDSQMIPSQEVESNRIREKEEKPFHDTKANDGEKNITSNASGSEAIANDIFDHNGFEVEHIGATNYTENDQQLAGENGHSGHPSEMSLDQMAESKAHGRSSPTGASQGSQAERTAPHLSHNLVGSSVQSSDHNRYTAEDERAGSFGVLKNAFSRLSQTGVTETTEPTESSSSLDSSTDETSQPLSPEQRLDPTADTSRDYLVTMHTQQLTQPSLPSTPSPHAITPPQTKTISKHYKNLLSHVSLDEITILMELFGQHKLQFLDYVLGSSDTVSEDPANDESILSDIERLLHHHRETLVTPNMRLADAPQEDKEKTRKLISLQKLDMLLGRLRETFNTGKADVNKANHQAVSSCVGASCSTHQHTNIQRDEWMAEGKDSGELGGVTEKMRKTEEENIGQTGTKEESVSPESYPRIQPGSLHQLEGVMKQILDFIGQITEDSTIYAYSVKELFMWIAVQVVSSLPDDIRPGPDLYGVPWEPVIFSSLVGFLTMLLFTCRCYSSVKSRMYRSKERWMAEQVAQLLDEKCKVLETLSKCQQEYDDLEDSLNESGVLAQNQKTEQLEIKARQLEQAKRELESDLGHLKDQLQQQQEHRQEQERRITVLEKSMNTLEEETKDFQSQEEQAQTTLKVYSMNSDRLQRNLGNAGEENTLLKESNAQLRQQAEGWAERVSELEAEMRRCEVTYSGMQQDVANKDERIMSLTDRLLRMKAWDSELEEEEGEEKEKETSNGTTGKGEENKTEHITDTQAHLQKVQKLIYAAKLNADLKSLDEDKDRVYAKLNDEVKAKEDLQESIKELENEKLSLQSDAENYSDQAQRLQQKLQIMTEMYQENELKLHRLLTVEERERLQKEEKLNKADKNIALAIEEVNNYRQRAEEMEEELEKTKLSYQAQISAHEKKAHNNWLAARAAERDLADIRRENALLRQKLTDTQFKLDAIDKDPYALDSLARPLPFRAERSPYGPSPLGRPGSETRAFLSPPTLMDGPPTRLSPRVSHGPLEPPGGQGELERSGDPHSDNGSISPTWERDRRGPPLGPLPGPLGPPGPIGPSGYMLPEPVGPMYRRPPPPPGAINILPPPGSLPPGPLVPHSRGFPFAAPTGPSHPTDMPDGMYRENLGPGEQEHRESGPGDRRTPPEAHLRMGGPLPPGPSVGPMDASFPRRAHYGPPPPDFFPTRGPGGPPMRPMWASPPPGMMFPPRFSPGGPPGPPAPHPHYATPMRPPAPDGLPPPSTGPPPPQQSLLPPPHSQSEEHTPSPEDNI